MSKYLDRAAELIEQALQNELHNEGVPRMKANAQQRAADRLAELGRIEHSANLEGLRPVLEELGTTKPDAEAS